MNDKLPTAEETLNQHLSGVYNPFGHPNLKSSFIAAIESHTAAHTAGLREEIRQLQSDVAHNADKALEIAMERDALRERVKELEALMREFVDRVDKGEVRSVKTYAKFKEALK